MTVWEWAQSVERPLAWLGKHTGLTDGSTIYRYRSGDRRIPDDWKRKAERLAGRKLDWPNGKGSK